MAMRCLPSSRVASHRDLKAWQHAKTLAVGCLKASRVFPAYEERGLADQLRRASTSVALNIAEGCNRGSNKEFRQFLDMARTSLDEVAAILDIAGEAGYLNPNVHGALVDRQAEAARTLYGLLRAVNARLESGEVARLRRPGSARGGPRDTAD
jgi:four helix bundle protein